VKRIFFFLLLLTQGLQAQDFSDSWEGFFSFAEIVDIEHSPEFVYAAGVNAILKYDQNSNVIETITTINGLTGDAISKIYYSETKSKLVIGYENGILQVIDDNGTITTVVAINEKQVIAANDKRINQFLESGDLLYIATGFGIALYNLDLLEFDDTYFIGDGGSQLDIRGIEIYEGLLYAATNTGIRRADISNPFLIDFMNWSQVIGFPWDDVITFNNRLLAPNPGRNLWELIGASQFVTSSVILPSRAVDIMTSGDLLAITSSLNISIFNGELDELLNIGQIDGETLEFTNAQLIDNTLYIGTKRNGLIRLNIQNPSEFFFIDTNSPSNNGVFSVENSESGLWIGYGNYDVFYNPFPLESEGISNLKSEEPWVNYTFDEILNANSVSGITINPSNPEELFINSMDDGVVQFESGVAITRFVNSNSSFTLTLDSNRPVGNQEFYKIPDSSYDGAGNLWVLQTETNTALHRRSSAGQWSGIDFSNFFPGILASATVTKMEIDQAGRIYFGTTNDGLFAYDPRNETFGRLTEGIQQGDLINDYVGALRIDQNNTLWIGSFLGLRVLSNPSSMFEDQVRDARAIIIEDINGIPRELLQDQAIVDIEVDGNNNKWIATSSAGALLLSPSGQETIFQFTKENSPLPTNSVNDISIDENTGKIYFATDGGLVAFQGTRSSKPQEDLSNLFAFPNPVRPGFEGNVIIDGLTERARVKIVDIEGNLVYEAVSQGGSIPWDTRSFSGNKVASGVYLLLVNTDDTIETKVFKLMIVR
jgi:ligand-binding sensor domain-containing protein